MKIGYGAVISNWNKTKKENIRKVEARVRRRLATVSMTTASRFLRKMENRKLIGHLGGARFLITLANKKSKSSGCDCLSTLMPENRPTIASRRVDKCHITEKGVGDGGIQDIFAYIFSKLALFFKLFCYLYRAISKICSLLKT